ncbi:hypothetical protein FB45DRAFT_1007675 [Roridomyces roridus]|uniref:Uncharacterized protein n=1 Tax=Roridomyces roridus TaxID=1738132 RepID=A0AAD7FG13_9AGAR|nr:hypothetical protein FB45DRAFT_1007675 [Roridomyces roridus]
MATACQLPPKCHLGTRKKVPRLMPPVNGTPGNVVEAPEHTLSQSTFAGAFFPQSQNSRISGGTFTSHVHITPPSALDGLGASFAKLARWEIVLTREIRMDQDCRTVSRGWETGGSSCRVFSAKVQNADSPKSVILYEGETAENAANMSHDMPTSGESGTGSAPDCLPVPGVPVCCKSSDVSDVLHRTCRAEDKTLWIRGSTGRLCVEFAPREMTEPPIWDACIKWSDPTWEVRAVDSLSLDEFHYFCSRGLAQHYEARLVRG